jgi:homoserine O-acetyltransferase/O-succinyltransferase
MNFKPTLSYSLLFLIIFFSTIIQITLQAQEVKLLNHKDDYFFLKNYTFRSGETLDEVRLHYSTLGTPMRDAAGDITNAVLFLHWTGGGAADLLAPAYQEELFGAGRALDLEKYYVIVPDNIGHGRSSKPSDGLRAKFPHYGFSDMIDLQRRLVTEKLGVKRLHLILGLSIGGMHAWMWGEQFPDQVNALMPIVALPAPVSGRNLLWRRIITQAIRTDPTWKNGDYVEQPQSWKMTFPLMLMMAEGVSQFQRTIETPVQAEAFVQKAMQTAANKDANDILYSLESSADYNPQHLERITAKLFALNFADDEFNPVELNVLPEAIKRVKDGRFFIVPTNADTHGHASQMHPKLWSAKVKEFLSVLE